MRRRAAVLLCCACLLAPAVARADPSHLVGELAPPVRARPLSSDEEVTLAQYRGRVVVLAFVATWCGSCRRLAPELDALAERYAARGLTVLALSHEPRRRLRAHVADEPRRYETLQCTGRTAVQYGADALPTIVVIDRDGRVAAAHQGATVGLASRLRRDVEALL